MSGDLLAEPKKKKKRIYQVAKEFHLSNEALIEFLTKYKYKVRNHMAPLDDDMYQLVCDNFMKAEVEVTKDSDYRKRIQEKHDKEEARREAVRQEIHDVIERTKEGVLEPTHIVERQSPKVEKKKKKIVEEKAVESKERSVKKTEQESKPEKETDKKDSSKKKAPLSLDLNKTKKPAVLEEDVNAEINPEEVLSKQAEKSDEIADDDKPKRTLKRRPKAKERRKEEQVKSKKEEAEGKKKRKLKTIIKEEAEEGEARPVKKKRRKKKSKVKIDEKEIEASIKQTFARMDQVPKKKRRKKEKDADEFVEIDENVIQVTEFISVSELANLLEVNSSEVITACFSLGLMVSINQRLDKDTILMVADEFDYDVDFLSEYGEEQVEMLDDDEDDPSLLEPRPPVVTIMGHVDHGKTSLLDHIRESNIIAGEAGGITQHIGAYEVTFNNKQIAFLDTPGHEAFTAMRARGAQVTDIVVLVVAADDKVMPQTIEAINHARAAGVPLVIAINKVDKSVANPDLIKQELSQQDVLVEDWGGKVQCALVSAKTGQGIDGLMESILLEAELLELKANPNRKAQGVIIEAQLDKGRGIVATILVQKGTMRIGDPYVAGQFSGRVRAMFDERNNPVKEAPPSTPVQVLGLSGMPQAGDVLTVMDSEQDAREISVKRQQLKREQSFRQIKRLTLDQISKQIAEGAVKELAVIIKADVDGSAEALSDSLMELGTDDVAVRIMHKGVGAISESDVLLAMSSNAVIIGFHVAPNTQARLMAQKEQVDIRMYKVIYDVVNDIKLALSGLLEPEVTEEVIATVEVRDLFKASKIGVIAGCYVQSGKINRNSLVRLIRDGKVIFEGKLSSLKRFKEDAKEVATGFECGLTLDGYSDVRVGDTLEAYELIETARTLE